MNTIVGKKIGMTRVYNPETGVQTPVTVIEVGPCTVVQRKTLASDGYDAAQLGFLPRREKNVTKPLRGHFAKAGAACASVLREVRLDEGEQEVKAGDTVDASLFDGAAFVDVTAHTKGRGFQGVVKRYRMGGGRASHGGKGSLRSPGSIGMREWPGRVFKNKKMPGQMGNRQVTVQNLRVVQVRPEDHAILVEGAVPGPTGGVVLVRKAIKKAAKS